MVDRFADGSSDPPGSTDPNDPQGWHGGDLDGLIDRVGWLEEQGYGALWITPITDALDTKTGEWGAYHGYWMHDPAAVDPRFGTVEDLARLSNALHERDMRLILDQVVNHVGYDAPILTEHPDWVHGHGDIEDWSDATEVVTHDVHGLPDLAVETEPVATWLTDAGRHWIATVRPDAFRIDAVRHVPPGFVKDYGDAMRRAAPDHFVLLGEIFDGNPAALGERMRSDRLDSVFDFPLMYGIQQSGVCDPEQSLDKLAANLFTARHLPPTEAGFLAPLVTLLDNHDTPRIAGICEHPAAALALQYGVSGTPSVTWGTEQGQSATEEPANRASMDWDAPMPLAPVLKQLNGIRADWTALRKGHQAIASLEDDRIHIVRSYAGTRPDTVHVVHRTSPGLPPELPDARAAFVLRSSADPARSSLPALEPYQGGPFAGTLLYRSATPEPFEARPAGTLVAVHPETPLDLKPGQQARVVGSAPEVGGWSAELGAEVLPTGQARLNLPEGTATAVKLVVIDRDGTEHWSQATDVTVLAGGRVRVRWEP